VGPSALLPSGQGQPTASVVSIAEAQRRMYKMVNKTTHHLHRARRGRSCCGTSLLLVAPLSSLRTSWLLQSGEHYHAALLTCMPPTALIASTQIDTLLTWCRALTTANVPRLNASISQVGLQLLCWTGSPLDCPHPHTSSDLPVHAHAHIANFLCRSSGLLKTSELQEHWALRALMPAYTAVCRATSKLSLAPRSHPGGTCRPWGHCQACAQDSPFPDVYN
jgi:hypothetical protein